LSYLKLSICTVLALLAASPALWAHHSPSAIFDLKHPAELKGTITKVDWVNPHIVVYMDAKSEVGGTASWKFESNPPMYFRKVGVTRADFVAAIGQEVTVKCLKAINGASYGYLVAITFPNGNLISFSSDDIDRGAQPAPPAPTGAK